MNGLNVYLSGAVKYMKEEFQNWRDECMDYAKHSDNLNIIDPNKYFNYTDNQPVTNKQCLDLFMWLVEKSDVLLINLDYSNISCGSMAEVEHAHCYGVPVIGFGENPETWYSWAEERCSVVFEDFEEALEYINASYGSI